MHCYRRLRFVPEQFASKSEVVIEKDGDGFSITTVHLTVAAKIPGIDHETFQSIAAKVKARAAARGRQAATRTPCHQAQQEISVLRC
jgi:organic hydroperoxide reductase OsmC/OhrA